MKRIVLLAAALCLAGCGGSDSEDDSGGGGGGGTPGSVDLSSSTARTSGEMTFTYSGSAYDTTFYNHWRITSANGYMQFGFNGQQAFTFHALGSTISGVSHCYVDVYVNGVLYWDNKFMDEDWTNYTIPASAFGAGANTVKIVLVGQTHVWIDRASVAGGGGGGGGAGNQVWVLENGFGQRAKVVVTAFTYSGTFWETSDSPGWFIDIGGMAPVRFRQLGGNIARAAGGDHWSFVTLGASSPTVSCSLMADGYANGNFPNATTVSGTYSGTMSTPLNRNQPVNGTWRGWRE